MEIETAANPADVADTAVIETAPATTDEAQTQAEGQTDDTNVDPLADLLPPEDEFEEVDYEGSKYKVPKPLKDAFLRQSDYTRKTQEAAELRRQADADRSRYQQLTTLTAAEIRATSRLETVQGQLSQYESINWSVLDHTDPEVQQAKGQRDELAREAANLRTALNEHFSTKSREEQQESAKFRQDTDQEAAKVIKDWSPEKRQTLETFAVNHGISPEMAPLATAAEFKLLNLAHIGEQFIERQRAAARAQAAGAAKPAPEVGSAGAGVADPAGMSMAEYVEARKAGKI